MELIKTWEDVYIPMTLEDLDFHRDQDTALKNLVKSHESRCALPHLLLYGPFGGGKRTRVKCLLRALFKISEGTVAAVDATTISKVIGIQTSSGNTELTAFMSPYHLELSPSDVGHKDLSVVQQVLKSYVESGNESIMRFMGNNIINSTLVHQNPPYRIVIINRADTLSHEAQAALRRTMEAYTDHVRFILVATSLEGVIDPLQSRCLSIQIPLMKSRTLMHKLLLNAMVNYYSKSLTIMERNTAIQDLIDEVINISGGNMTRAYLLLHSTVANLPKTLDDDNFQKENLLEADWIFIVKTIMDIVLGEKVAPESMNKIRTHSKELQTHCIPFRNIVTLCAEIVARKENIENAAKRDIFWVLSHYDHRAAHSQFQIIFLDGMLIRMVLIMAGQNSKIAIAHRDLSQDYFRPFLSVEAAVPHLESLYIPQSTTTVICKNFNKKSENLFK